MNALHLSMILVCSSGMAMAAEAVPSISPSSEIIPLAGQETETWLILQREGAQASPYAQSLPAAYHERAAQRFMKTLDQPIPATSMAQGSQ